MKTTKVRADELKPGMKLAANTYDAGQRTLLVRKGTRLTEEIIEGLRKRGIDSVPILEEDAGTTVSMLRLPLPPDAKRRAGVPFTYPESLEEKIFLDYQGRLILKIDDPVIESTKKKAVDTAKKVLSDVSRGSGIDVTVVEDTANLLLYAISLNRNAFLNVAGIHMVDEYTFIHSVDVAAYTVIIAKEYGFGGEALETICNGALLHDVGKMLVDQQILNKPGRLTSEEFAEVKRHTDKGFEILLENGIVEEIAVLAKGHHERCNGSGYPEGLTGDVAPISVQMAAIADVYDALTSNRVYKKAIDANSAMSMIVSESGKHFDADLVTLFQRSIGIYPVGSQVKLNNGFVARVLEQNEGIVRPIIQLIRDETGEDLGDMAVINLMDNEELYIVESCGSRLAA